LSFPIFKIENPYKGYDYWEMWTFKNEIAHFCEKIYYYAQQIKIAKKKWQKRVQNHTFYDIIVSMKKQ